MQSNEMKKAYYFPHDLNARNDPKLQDVMIELGLEGIGAYWCIIEQLYEQEGQLPVKALKGIAFTLHMDFPKLQRLISEFDLFLIEGDVLTSPAVAKRREAMIEKSYNAKKSITNRWKKKADNKDTNVLNTDTNVIRTYKNCDTNVLNTDTNVIRTYKNCDTNVLNTDTNVIRTYKNCDTNVLNTDTNVIRTYKNCDTNVLNTDTNVIRTYKNCDTNVLNTDTNVIRTYKNCDTNVLNTDTNVIRTYKNCDTNVLNTDTNVIPIKENKRKEKKEYNISSNDDKSNMPLDSSAGGVNYQGIIQFYNSTMEQSGATIPKVKSIEGTRKKHVSARIREYGRNAFADMIRKAAASDFLNGRNERGFTATFDWLIRPSNFIKVIEGNYDSNKNYSNSNGNPRLKDNQRRGTLEVSATSADDYKTTF